MFSRHPETNPHFSSSEPPASDQNAPNLSSSVLQGMRQPRRQRTRGPRLAPPSSFDPNDQNAYPPSMSHSEQVLEPRDRAHGPSLATVLPPEGPDYPDHYPLHPHGKDSSHSHSPGGALLPPPHRGKSRKTRVQWEQTMTQAVDEHALPPGRPAPSITLLETDKSQPNQGRRHQRHHNWYLLAPMPRKTKALTWFIALFCALIWIVVIVGGLIVLVVYLMFRPHIPRFDISSATLNAAYLDVDYLLNADLTLLANFTNPNRKVRVDFSYVILDLYYGNVPIATQYIEPFSAMRSESKLESVHMISSQVRLPSSESQQLRKQIESNGPIFFEVKGLFRARSNLGSLLRYSYPLYGHCFIALTGPPSGVLRASRCKTKR